MKRPPGLWILLSAGFLWLSLDDVHGIRATSLIFKSTTTTTTTTTAQPDAPEEESVTTEQLVDANSTKPTLTGNPQLDYVWDPNLPKELNGYNLSDYPFYERVPEDIDFKCDGLHDGFYASVKHKCQVYHHCLYGTRYDFLCANYTAFDQKTFICHFASEVDCVNSKKFWHRNDALYQTTSTTTIKPFVIYTPPPQLQPQLGALSPVVLTDGTAPIARRPLINQRPLRRRRPQFDYYDDYYDEYYDERRATRGRKRPRPRPRPIYYDDYDEDYEDDRYDWRANRRRNEKRRPYDRKGVRRKNNDRNKNDYDEDLVEQSEEEEDDYRLSSRRKNKDKKKEVELAEDDDITDERPYRRRRPVNSEYKRPRKPLKNNDETRTEEITKESVEKNKERPIIKPVSGTIYDKPRVAPKIKLPVPKHEAQKYAYKPIGTEAKDVKENMGDYEDYEYEDEQPRNQPEKTYVKQKASNSADSMKPSKEKTIKEEYDEQPRNQPEKTHVKQKTSNYADSVKPSTEKTVIEYEEYDETYDDEHDHDDDTKIVKPQPKPTMSSKMKSSTTLSTTTTTTSTTTSTTTMAPTTEIYIGRLNEPLIRLVKRPFLPSRGGSPFVPRGLQPVGARALELTTIELDNRKSADLPTYLKENIYQEKTGGTSASIEGVFKPSSKLTQASQTPILDGSYYISLNQNYNQQPVIKNYQNRNPNENEYDTPVVNESRNQMTSNTPARLQPAVFRDQSRDPYYGLQPSRYNTNPVMNQPSYNILYQNSPLRATYQIIPQTDVREPFVHSSSDFKGQKNSVINENDRPRQVQNTQAYYTRL